MRILGQVEWDIDKRGDRHWRVRALNGNILADTEGYARAIDARRAKLTATKILVADLTDEEFYAAAAYRSTVRSGGADDDGHR